MKSMMSQYGVGYVVSLSLLAGGLFGLAGCKTEKSEREHGAIRGTILNVDEATGKITVRHYSEKKKKHLPREITVTPKTEIFINGRIAQLNEIKTSEQVVVAGYAERDGSRKRMVAQEIKIERDDWSSAPRSATQPTTQPAKAPAAKPAKP